MPSGWRLRRGGSLIALSPEAQNVLASAWVEARRVGHDQVGTEHLLLALADPLTGIAARAIRASGVDLERLRSRVATLRMGKPSTPTDQPPFTSQLRSAMEKATAVAGPGKAARPEHLLLGLFGLRESGAATLLVQLDADLAQLLSAIEVLQDQPSLDERHLREATAARRHTARVIMEKANAFGLLGSPQNPPVESPRPAIEMNAMPEVATADQAIETSVPSGPTRSVFISYRRQQTPHQAGRLYDRLAERFGRAQVFNDIASIEPGDDFREVIEEAVGSSAVLLALIGPDWTRATDSQGRRRLDDPDDYVRLEIETALKCDIRVIPLLVDDAAMPRAQELPASLSRLPDRNALRLGYESFDGDVRRLIESLATSLKSPTRTPAGRRGR